jgi:hypothetical protein
MNGAAGRRVCEPGQARATKVEKTVSNCPDSLEEEEGDIGMHTCVHAKSVRLCL